MTARQTTPTQMWKLLSSALLALLVAYAIHPLIRMGALVLEPYGLTLGDALWPLIWAVQAAGFALAFMWLIRVGTGAKRVQHGLIAAGLVLLSSVPLFVIGALQTARLGLGDDPDAMVDTALTGLLFSGQYGILAVLCLGIGTILQITMAPYKP